MPTMEERRATADSKDPATIEYFANGDLLVIEGTRQRVIVGQPLEDNGEHGCDERDAAEAEAPGQDHPMPNMAFHGHAQTVLSGSDFTVSLPGLPEREQGLKTTCDSLPEDKQYPDFDSLCAAKCDKEEDDVDKKQNEEKPFETEFELDLDKLSDGDSPEEEQHKSSFSVPRGSSTHLHFHTQANGLTVQGVGMTVAFDTSVGKKQSSKTFSSHGAGFRPPNMTFSSKDSCLVVRGSNGIVEVNPQQHQKVAPLQASIPSGPATPASGACGLQKQRKPSDYLTIHEIPVSVLSYDLRHQLAMLLDPPSLGSDWRLFADRLGISNQEIRYMESKESPTMAVLSRFEQRGEFNATVGKIIWALHDLGRTDTLGVLTQNLLQV